MQNQTATPLDPRVVSLAKAISQTETGGNYTAKGASREYGVAQWTPETWNAHAKDILGYVPKFATQEMSPDIQKAVLYGVIYQDKQKGLNPAQIAAKWNSGSPDGWENKVGVNKYGVKYDVPKYVKSVTDAYQSISKGQSVGVDPNNPSSVAGTQISQSDVHTGTLGTNPNDSLYGKLIDNSITRGIENFFPGKRVGEAIGTLAGYGVAKMNGTADHYDLSAPTPLQTIGDVAQGALTVAMPGAGEGAGLATRIGAQAAIGAGFGATGALANGATNLGDIASATGKGALIGGALGTAGELVSGAINKAVAPYSKDFLPETEQTISKVGLNPAELPISTVSNSKTIRYMESLYGGERMAEQVSAAQLKLDQITSDVLAKTGVSEDLSTAGQQIAKGLNDFETAYKTEIGKLYDTFSKQGGSTLPAKPFTTVDTLHNIIDSMESIGEGKDAQYFINKLEVVTGGESKTASYKMPTFDTLKQLRTAVGEKIKGKFNDPFVSQNIGKLKQLYGALSKDMEQTITDTGNKKLIDSLATANKAYVDGRNLLNTDYAKTINKLASTGQYDKIIPALVSPSKSIANIPALLKVIGPENLPRLQSAILEDIFTKAQGLGETFTEKGVAKMINKYGEDRLAQILTPEQLVFVKDLDMVVKALASAERISKGSQTAFLAKSYSKLFLGLSSLKDLLTGNVMGAVTSLAPILGEQAAEKFLSSQLGRRILTTGLKIGSAREVIRQTTKVGTMQATK